MKNAYMFFSLFLLMALTRLVFAACAPGSTWTASWTDSFNQTTYTLEAPCKAYVNEPFSITATVTDNDYPNGIVAYPWAIFDTISTSTKTRTTVAGYAGGADDWIVTENGQWQKVVSQTYTGDPVDHRIEFRFTDLGAGSGGHYWGSSTIGDITVDPYPPVTGTSLLPVKRTSGGTSAFYYTSLQAAYDAAASGNTIQSRSAAFEETVLFNRPVTVSLTGGYDSTFAPGSTPTMIKGALRISDGKVKVGNLKLTEPDAAPPPPDPVPVILSLSAPGAVQAGQPCSLAWSVQDADQISLSPGSAVQGNGITVFPSETTIYVLTATKGAASTQASVIVNVTAAPVLATASINDTLPGQAASTSFLGLSHEWETARAIMGTSPAPTNPSYVQLIKNLDAFGNGPFVIRIGGTSTDTSGAPPSGAVDPFAAVHAATGARFILGLNLGANDVSLASGQADAYLAGMPSGSVLGWEIGNEPDRYGQNGMRDAGYTFQNYLTDFSTWRSALIPSVLAAPNSLAGPAWGDTASLTNLQEFLSAETGNLALVTQHHYPYDVCNGNPAPAASELLSQTAAGSGAAAVAPSVTTARSAGLDFRLAEVNSVGCGGAAGVSDTFASSLWGADLLFEMSAVGASGVNFHNSGNAADSVFTFDLQGSGGDTVYVPHVQPLYYGMLLFAQATAWQGRPLPLSMTTSANLKAWAFLDANGAVRVAVINKDTIAAGVVTFQLPGRGAGSLSRLLAPGLTATNGITCAGQTFDGTTDGLPLGTPFTEAVQSVSGTYTVALPPVSAALLVVP
jgi:hypothetical protein